MGLDFVVRAKLRKQRTKKNNLSGREHSFSREVLPMSDCKGYLVIIVLSYIEHHDTNICQGFTRKVKSFFFIVLSNLPRIRLKKRLERNLDIHLWFISGEKQF